MLLSHISQAYFTLPVQQRLVRVISSPTIPFEKLCSGNR